MTISINYKTRHFSFTRAIKPEILQINSLFVSRVLLGVIICVGVMFSLESHAAQKEHINPSDSVSGVGILDGLTFTSENGMYGEPGDRTDTLIFKEGKFVSTNCEKNCNYPSQAYFARRLGDKIEFIVETRCQTQDAELVWRGTVDGDNIEGTYSWRSSRWYWTLEKEFWFKGSAEKNIIPTGIN
jgi:hypothetical protein